MSNFSIIQWNARSLFDKKEELLSFASVINVDCFIICETWLKENQNFSMSGFVISRFDRPSRGGGVLIAIKKNLFIKNLELKSDKIECTGIQVLLNNKPISIASVYVPPGRAIYTADLDNLFNQIPEPRFIGGDFNAHDQAWGCVVNDTRGNEIINSLNNSNLIFLNNGEPTRISPPPNRSSAVDLTLCSPNFGFTATWKTLDSPGTSDHLPILIKLISNNINSHSRCLYRTNWISFRSQLKDIITPDIFDVNVGYRFLIDSINNALNFSKTEVKSVAVAW